MGCLDQKVAMVTGAASGMGRAEALLFGREGAVVIATDINETAVQQVVQEIIAQGGQAVGYAHDVASEAQWSSIVADVVARYERIDVLVNNAGISFSTSMLDTTLEQWQRVMDINLSSVFLGMQAVIPHMQKQQSGSIINIASIAGMAGSSGAGAYTASKGGVRLLSKSAAVDYGKDNIRVNTVHPGYIETPMSASFMQQEQMKQWFLSKTALPRVGQAEDVAQAVLFLASDASAYITGVDLPVDGGVTAK